MSKELRGLQDEHPNIIMRYDSETARLLSGEYKPSIQDIGSDDEQQDASKHAGVAGGNSSNFSAVLNLCNTVLGSGVLGMATAIHRAGLGYMLLLLPFMAVVAMYSIQLVVLCMQVASVSSYSAIGQKAFGRKGKILVIFVVIVQQLGASIAYLVILADVIQPFMAYWTPVGVLHTRWLVQIIVAALLFPVCMLKSINSLKYASAFSLLFLLSFVVLVVAEGGVWWSQPGNWTSGADIAWFNNNVGALGSVPILAFAFVCQQNVPPVYADLKKRTARNWRKVNVTSVIVCSVVYFIAGLSGYLRWRSFPECIIPHDLLTNYFCPTTIIFDVVLIACGLSFALSWPLMLFELRHSLDLLIFGHQLHNYKRSFFLNLCLIIPIVTIAYFVPGIVQVFDVIGSTSGVMLVFIMPSMFWIKLRPIPLKSRENIIPVLVISLGVLFGVASFAEALNDLITNPSFTTAGGIAAGQICRTHLFPNVTSDMVCNTTNVTASAIYDYL